MHPNEVVMVVRGKASGLPIASMDYVVVTQSDLTPAQREALGEQANRQVRELKAVP